jgi:general L-amino acid transport system substrate-binding protein
MKKYAQTVIGTVLATAGLLAATSAMAGKTLDQIKQRGQIVCGVNTGLAGFSAADSSGNWSGLDVDHCRAVAAAVLSDATKVKYVPLTAQQRFHRTCSLVRSTCWPATAPAPSAVTPLWACTLLA